MTEDERWMEYAVKEAELAYRRKELPIGAVLVREGRILGKGYNQIESLQDPTAHAEMIAITAAAAGLGSRRLEGCTMYVTLEPCAMCVGAIVLAREYGALVKPAGDLGQTEAGLTTVVMTLVDNLTWPVLIAGLCGIGLSLMSQVRRWLALALGALLIMNVAFAGLFGRAVFLPAALMPALLALVVGAGLLAQWLGERRNS